MKKTKIFLASLFLAVSCTISYSQPVLNWEDNFHVGLSGDESFNDMVSDGLGSIYATGWYDSVSADNHNIITVKYKSDGSRVWIRKFDFQGRTDQGYRVFVGKSGYVYVVGEVTTSGYSKRIIVLKYSEAGSLIWANNYHPSGHSGSGFFRGAFFKNNIIYVTSQPAEIGSYERDIAIYKIRSDGTFNSLVTGTPGIRDNSQDICLDNAENIYVVGESNIAPYSTTFNSIVMKYSNSLVFQWRITIRDTIKPNTFLTCVRINSSGKVIISGNAKSLFGGLSHSNSITASLNSADGSMNWYNRFSNPDDKISTVMNTMTIDKFDNVILGGLFLQDPFIMKGMVCKLKYTGILLSFNSIDSLQYVNALETDSISNVYASGLSSFGGKSIFKYDASASLQWFYDGSTFTYIRKILLSKPDFLYICGSGLNSATNLYTAKLTLLLGSSKPLVNEPTEIESFKLHDNFPNPFNPSTSIKFSVPSDGLVTLKVFDVTGKEAASLVNENLEQGEHEVNFNASHLSSGVYFYKLISGSFTEVKKMILVK